ncbi:DUF1330 domain-containing protein [Labrys sp. LIt4]|uniref:DUF1330 domain-containing protein n=1 Tax=Labrys sp. LIt4 TaxID=2821355 RepID=UPI001AE037F9|nr:DUF1330 domain-containing protein [Labrys sp. LIt4]MBP0582642.1 DUF1330 domain-containing protein [Labrys sp. LIt4]
MSGFIIASIDVEDRELFDRYVDMVENTIRNDGFKVDALFDDHPYLFDGKLPSKRIVLMKFESVDQAKKFYYSEGYQDAVAVRHASSTTHFSLLIDGELQRWGGQSDAPENAGASKAA